MSNESGHAEDMTVVTDGCMTYIHYIEGVGGGYVFDSSKAVLTFHASFLLINLISLPGANL